MHIYLAARQLQIERVLHVILNDSDDGSDGAERFALARVLDVMLSLKETGKHPTLEQLQRAVAALEVVAGYKYVEPIDPADQIIVAQADLDETLFKSVHPDLCPEPLRTATIDHWVEIHTNLASKAVAANESSDVVAAEMVNHMRELGAYIVPYGSMRAGQQLFWRQRAAGYNHGVNHGLLVTDKVKEFAR